jgi:hypothetical protein
MRARIVSAVLDLTTNPKGNDILSFTIAGEIECTAASILPGDLLTRRSRGDDHQPHYLTWKGTVLKRSIPFLCVGDN